MVLHKAQSQIAKSSKRFRVCCCGRRFGKTTLAVYEMLTEAIKGNDRKVAYLSPTYQQSRDIAWAELKSICQPVAVEINESRLEIEVTTNQGGTSKIFLRSWDSIETLRGQAFHFLVVDEIAMMKGWGNGWKEVLRPTLTDHKGGVLFISTPKGYNHFYELYNMDDKDYESFHFTSYDNPFLDKEELDKAQEELNEDEFAQEYMADFRKMQGLVYKEFARNLHVFDPEDKTIRQVEFLGGVDFGFTNPCGVVDIVKDFDGRYWVMDEWYPTGKTDAEIAEYVAQKGYNLTYPDPENPGGIEELRRKMVAVRDVVKGKGSVQKGINKVRDMFKQHRLQISKNCKNLIWELETYHYPDSKPDRNEDEAPIKENDHLCDALRYVIMSQEPTAPAFHTPPQAPKEKTNLGL